MKTILFTCLSFCILLFASCESEPQKQLKDSTGKIIENNGPVYKTSACEQTSDREAMRRCGDIQLVQMLEQAIIEAHGNEVVPPTSKLVVEFDVKINGKPAAITVSRGINKSLDKAAVQFIKKTRWLPAIHGGEEQQIHKRIPLTFEF